MSSTPSADPSAYADDERLLHRLGYAQELFRVMGGFQNFAISFTIISILAGCLTSYYIAFQWGGPVAVTWGWLLVGGFCIIVSLAMGEVASTYPTAGGLYYWASKLGGPGYGWFTGWFNLVGQIAVTAAIGYGLAIFATSLLDLLFNYPNTSRWIFVTYSVVMLLAVVVNMYRVRMTAALNTISAWWHMIGVLVIVGILIVVPDHHQSVGYVFGETINNSGFSGQNFGDLMFLYVFGIGLLMAQYTITGYDASAHMSEETHQASRMAAIGLVMSVVVSVFFGFILLLAVTFAIPDTQGVIAAGGYAVTVLAIGVLAWALMLPTLKNAVVGYLVGTSIAVIGLYIAFAIPIYLRWRAAEKFERGAWHLGERYRWLDPIAIAWIVVICILFMLPIAPAGIPWKDGFDWNIVNYAPITVGGAFLLFGGWYALSAKRWFKGPIRMGTEEELERIEEELDRATPAVAGARSSAS